MTHTNLQNQNTLQIVQNRIDAACAQAGRTPGSVRLLAVSKTFDADSVRRVHAQGQTAFGENYIQEGVEKITALQDLKLEWHCIGPVQSNKSRLVAEHFDWVHTVSSLKLAERLSAQRPAHLGALNVCIQINIDDSASKSGVSLEAGLVLARLVAQLPNLRLRGLMSIPDPAHSAEETLHKHLAARRGFDAWRDAGLDIDTLSLGMSQDLESAIQAGSTMVRVGTAIFGAR